MNYILLDEAEYELDQGICYYNNMELGLGEDFYDEIMRCIGRILDNPEAWTKVDKEIRRCLTDKFHYKISIILKNSISK
jgi:hypothetical protein